MYAGETQSGKKFWKRECKTYCYAAISWWHSISALPKQGWLNPRRIRRRKCSFGGRELLAEAHIARLGSSAAVSLVTSTSWQRKVRGTPRNRARRLGDYFYLLAKEVPRQIRQHNQAEKECRDRALAAKSDPCSSEGTEACLMGQKLRLEVAFLSGS